MIDSITSNATEMPLKEDGNFYKKIFFIITFYTKNFRTRLLNNYF